MALSIKISLSEMPRLSQKQLRCSDKSISQFMEQTHISTRCLIQNQTTIIGCAHCCGNRGRIAFNISTKAVIRGLWCHSALLVNRANSVSPRLQ